MSRYDGFKKAYYNRTETLSSFENAEDGSLIVHGVTIMAAGTWTDMHGITTTFSEDVLQRCASAWDDNAVWTRHAGGAPRSVTEKVGAVANPYYSPTDGAVMGDVILHNRTDTSRACSELVQMAREQGGIKDVSAETMVMMDEDGNVLDLVFTGLALVEDGACETCRIPAFGREESNMADEEVKTTEETKTTEEKIEGEEPETKTEDKVDDLLEMLVGFVEGIIPDTKEIIESIQAAEGEDRIRALGKLEGCMQAWGFPTVAEAYTKAMDEKLSAFSKSIDDKITVLQNQVAEYGRPAGLKGHAGADKADEEKPRPIVCFGRGVPRDY